MEAQLFIKEMREGVYLLDEDHASTGYLVIGEEKACVIDTMNGRVNLYEEVRKLTDKPLVLVNTHGHPDHIFGNVYFEEAYMHPADFAMAEMFAARLKEQGQVLPPMKPIHEGDVIDLGGRTLEIYEIPGHTPGGILLLLKEDRILFTGDSINHHLWMQLDGCLPVHEYVKVLDSLMFLEEKADKILHGHAHDFDDISLIHCLRNGAEDLGKGNIEGDEPYKWFGGEAYQHHFAVEADQQYQQDHHVICYRKDNL